MSGDIDQWYGKIRAATGIFVNTLAAHDYESLERISEGGRFTADELRTIVESYPYQLIEPAVSAFSSLPVTQRPHDNGVMFELAFPMWTLERDAPRLVLTLRLWEEIAGKTLAVQIRDLSVREPDVPALTRE